MTGNALDTLRDACNSWPSAEKDDALARVAAAIEAARSFMEEWREGVMEPESINDLAAALRAVDEGESR